MVNRWTDGEEGEWTDGQKEEWMGDSKGGWMNGKVGVQVADGDCFLGPSTSNLLWTVRRK